ncbi:hypothetical protein ASD64_08880 [Mesorhizobium sp. Root157]|uniref:Pam3-gp28 family putative phage holin n=1 Tax=Mesorhizobium sp. Root157 TaxID=1736477 RepID=UPI0006F86B56|nr:hypothetical protein [Mesorhizobium sp. Root157]KQZ81864.1 hypothetical protein ASD64_08880 [Mesorhizobium sp. Root157]
MASVIIRIGLRYGAAYLVARGLLSPDDGATLATDHDVQMLLGTAMGAVAEGWYYLARRFGWSK